MGSAVVRTRRRTLISVVVTVAALGWAPGQALAADSPVDPLLGSVAQTTSGAADPVDPVQGIVDQAADTVSGTADTLSDPLPDPVDEVVDTTTDTVEGRLRCHLRDRGPRLRRHIRDRGCGRRLDHRRRGRSHGRPRDDRLRLERRDLAGRSVSGRGAGCVLSRIFRQGWDRLGVVDQGDGVRPLRRSGPTRGTRRRWSGLRRRLDTLRHGDTDDMRDDEPGRARIHLAGTVAEIIRKLLAFTGWGALTWIAVALGLSIVGAAAVYHGGRRPRYSGSASSS